MYKPDEIKKIQGDLTNRYCADFIGVTERHWCKIKIGKHILKKPESVKRLKELAKLRGVK